MIWTKNDVVDAHKLWERLPTNTEPWYAAPYEDKSGTIKHPILII